MDNGTKKRRKYISQSLSMMFFLRKLHPFRKNRIFKIAKWEAKMKNEYLMQ